VGGIYHFTPRSSLQTCCEEVLLQPHEYLRQRFQQNHWRLGIVIMVGVGRGWVLVSREGGGEAGDWMGRGGEDEGEKGGRVGAVKMGEGGSERCVLSRPLLSSCRARMADVVLQWVRRVALDVFTRSTDEAEGEGGRVGVRGWSVSQVVRRVACR
jgi:hypothetical protein